MNLATARDYHALGVLTGAQVRAPFLKFQGWTIEFSGNLGNASPLMTTRRGEVREFKTLDAAAGVLSEVGIRQFSVILD